MTAWSTMVAAWSVVMAAWSFVAVAAIPLLLEVFWQEIDEASRISGHLDRDSAAVSMRSPTHGDCDEGDITFPSDKRSIQVRKVFDALTDQFDSELRCAELCGCVSGECNVVR
jgi:hypothetical protein